tara:strand:- start:402 stop:929 length:528 start_codon:yes stop_codon:yes gene_type:complete
MSTNVAAFEILYKEYYVRVFGLCRRILNSAELAEDATQETFMRAYRNFKTYDSEMPFWRWIATIANRHCIDLLRQRGRNQTLFGDEQEEMDNLASPEPQTLEQVIGAEDAVHLGAALGQMADRYRVPLVLAYFAEASYDQIAAELDISRNHVGVLLLRAKQQLRLSLDKAHRTQS